MREVVDFAGTVDQTGRRYQAGSPLASLTVASWGNHTIDYHKHRFCRFLKVVGDLQESWFWYLKVLNLVGSSKPKRPSVAWVRIAHAESLCSGILEALRTNLALTLQIS